MRKLISVLMLAVMVQACSMNDVSSLFIPPTQTKTPTATVFTTYTPLPTWTPSITPTITVSPTIVRIPTWDPNVPTSTFAPIPIFIGEYTATPVIPPTPVRPGPGFLSVTNSEPRIFWGDCTPNKSVVVAKVVDPEEVASVVIFVQVKSFDKEDYTPWTSGDVMFNYNDGTFSYTLQATEIQGHNHYKKSWVRMQLVATNIKGEEVGRTKIFPEVTTLEPCMCYEPLKGCPIPTLEVAP
ncbi:MAG: hypothetical protein IH588_12055 [Anaerolineales bacterium]|nr:hypothetical protein [Anaerolineales bacterium]